MVVGGFVRLGRVQLERAHGNRGLPNIVRAYRRTCIRGGVDPLAVRRLMRLQEHGHGIGVEIGRVMLGVEADQDVAQNKRSEEISHRSKETLVQVVAQLLQAEHVGFHLLRRGFFVDLETVFSSRADRHGRKAVVVAGKAGSLWNEIGIGPLDQGKACLDSALNSVLSPWFKSGLGRVRSPSRRT